MIALGLTLGSCSLFFGNIKPIEEKSQQYHIQDLSLKNRQWKALNPKAEGENSDAVRSDMAFESKRTASVASINSVCRSIDPLDKKKTLKELTQELLLGIVDIKIKKEENIQIADVPALMSLFQGKLDGEAVQLKTVVVQKDHCIYDFVLVGRPAWQPDDEADFNAFVSSFQIQ
jgi:hypothetical protein